MRKTNQGRSGDMEFKHVSVLLEECIEGLKIKESGTYVDGTLGGAGHAYEVCSRLQGGGRFIGIDQDKDALAFAEQKLLNMTCRVDLVHSNYEAFAQILADYSIKGVDGILLDLGVSSYQLDTANRGFSYMTDAPLDMRMDQTAEKTAADIVNTYKRDDLVKILKVYGEERFATRIANKIVESRTQKPFETTLELVKVIDSCIPTKYKIKYGHPAKRSFQAIRIELNRELDVLENTIQTMIDYLNPSGRLCIITFHSLEDRIVKHIFRENEDPCTCPKDFPICVCNKVSKGKMTPRKPILPSQEEMEKNSRSKSAKLRIFEKAGD